MKTDAEDPDEDNNNKPEGSATKPPVAPPPQSDDQMRAAFKEIEMKTQEIERLKTEVAAFKIKEVAFEATGQTLKSYETFVADQVKKTFEAIPETKRKFIKLDDKNPLGSFQVLNDHLAMFKAIEDEVKKENEIAGLTPEQKAAKEKELQRTDPTGTKPKVEDKPTEWKPPRTPEEAKQRFIEIKKNGIENPNKPKN